MEAVYSRKQTHHEEKEHGSLCVNLGRKENKERCIYFVGLINNLWLIIIHNFIFLHISDFFLYLSLLQHWIFSIIITKIKLILKTTRSDINIYVKFVCYIFTLCSTKYLMNNNDIKGLITVSNKIMIYITVYTRRFKN